MYCKVCYIYLLLYHTSSALENYKNSQNSSSFPVSVPGSMWLTICFPDQKARPSLLVLRMPLPEVQVTTEASSCGQCPRPSTGPRGLNANKWKSFCVGDREHLQGWGWSPDPASSGAEVLVQTSVQDLQGSLLGKTAEHLPSVVHSWLLEKKK